MVIDLRRRNRRWLLIVLVTGFLGPPLVGLVAEVAGFGNLANLAWFLLVAFFGAVFLGAWIYFFVLRRRIQDVATARLGSAAQGHAEVCGKAELIGPPETCPACGKSWCWWLSFQGEGDVNSKSMFALVEDGHRAIVDPTGVDYLYSGSPPSCLHVEPSASLYVMGDFKTVRASSLREAPGGDWPETVDLICQPSDSRYPFLFGASAQADVVKRLNGTLIGLVIATLFMVMFGTIMLSEVVSGNPEWLSQLLVRS